MFGLTPSHPIQSIDATGLDVYELRRTAHAAGGMVDHTSVFIDDTGIVDKKGRPVNYFVDFTDNGESIRPVPLSLDDFMKAGKKTDPDLRIDGKIKTTVKENQALADHFKKTSPKQNYHTLFNNCRSTFERAKRFISSQRSQEPDLPPLISL